MLRDTGSAEATLLAASTRRATGTASAWLRKTLPAGFGLAAAAITDRPASAYAAEELLIATAVDKRRSEFRTGRVLAREALAQIGCAPAPILARRERDPIWPAGFLGSISHSERLAVAVTAPASLIAGIGIDIEEDPKLDPDLNSIVCDAEEREQQPELAKLGIDHAKLCFVTKEAVYKATFPQQRRVLKFEQLRVVFHIPEGSFSVAICNAQRAFRPLRGTGSFLSGPELLMAAFVIRRRA